MYCTLQIGIKLIESPESTKRCANTEFEENFDFPEKTDNAVPCWWSVEENAEYTTNYETTAFVQTNLSPSPVS